MNVECYENLPDYMPVDEVAQCFKRLLRESGKPGVDPESVFEALWCLADRQYHTYERLCQELRNQIEQWISVHWQPTPENVDYIGMIAGGIGLPGVIPVLESSLSEEMSDDLRSEFEEVLEAIREHINDPYWDLRSLRSDSQQDNGAIDGKSISGWSLPLTWILVVIVALAVVVLGVVVLG
ncbi:hypothetical protein ACFL6W_07905 [Thermodesulfobacteriota bacterium]